MTQQKLDGSVFSVVNNHVVYANEVLKKLQDELWED
jgi:hypothetical protein